jgi:hypothetical protein
LTKIENIETVLDLTTKYLTKLKGYISDAPSLAKIENVETILDLTSKYLTQLKAIIPAAPALAKIENVEAVLDLTSNYLGQLKANIPADAFSVTIPTATGALTSTYQGNFPDSAKIENVKAVLDLTSEYLSQLKGFDALPGDIPTAAVPSTYDEAQLINTNCKNSLGLSVPCAVRRKRSPQEVVAAPVAYNTYTSTNPASVRIENVEAVLDFTSKYLNQLKTYIPADSLSVPIPTANGALPSTYLGNIPALARIENVEAVLDLTSKYLTQIKPYIPAAAPVVTAQ